MHGTCISSSGTCACDPNWGGAVCDTAAPLLDPASTESSSVAPGDWLYFSYHGTGSGLTASLSETATVGEVGLFLGAGQVPSQSSNLDSDENRQSASHSVSYTFAGSGTQTWYIAVYGEPATGGSAGPYSFNLDITVVP
jgi:hypothetical protein